MKEKLKQKTAKLKTLVVDIYHKDHEKTTAWAQVLISCIMLATILQNCRVIDQNTKTLNSTSVSLELQKVATSNAIQQLQIEEQTRQHPELECAYSRGHVFTNYGFILRNVGNAPATNIYLRTSVACVTSNAVYLLAFSRFEVGPGTAPLKGKLQLVPSDQAEVQDWSTPNMDWLEELMIKYQADVLVKLRVEYERPNPNSRRYSGCFNFVFSRNWFPGYLQTSEESPRVQQTLERFDSIPSSQRFMLSRKIVGGTNVWETFDSQYGRNVGGMDADNISGPMKPLNWTKHN